jgi:hypothetical protein
LIVQRGLDPEFFHDPAAAQQKTSDRRRITTFAKKAPTPASAVGDAGRQPAVIGVVRGGGSIDLHES